MKLIFERSVEGYHNDMVSPCDVPTVAIPEEMKRKKSCIYQHYHNQKSVAIIQN